ncbi:MULTISPECIES: hypothetical protein [Paenibacillus]|uniref:Uncharacterized protein n=2 Tax=Paenibacillus TaxID=44249 RepID=A0ABX2ZE52_PAEPO|nr:MULTISPECIES: hypothetical protein [Paenibacillus]MDR6779428.1 hypothetical protein [Paenibacillus peoriae]ODA08319.1 hypothetical protein A7312_27670 [Paenibacillus polymyxa]
MKRYRLMKLTAYDKEHKLKTWRFVNIEAEKAHELNNFMANGFRIWDSDRNKVVKTNLDLDNWIKDHHEE